MIEIYTKDYCPYCWQAKALLKSKDIEFTEYDVTHDAPLQRKMRKRTGGKTVPQIVIHDTPVGGASDLFELESSGQLDLLVFGKPNPDAPAYSEIHYGGL